MGNWNSSKWSEETLELVDTLLAKDPSLYHKEQLEALLSVKPMLDSMDSVQLFLKHPYAFKYIIQGVKIENVSVKETSLELVLDILKIVMRDETAETARRKCLRSIGEKMSVFWSLIGDDNFCVRVLVASILERLTTIPRNISKFSNVTVKQVLFYLRSEPPTELLRPLSGFLKNVVSEPVRICTIDEYGANEMMQEAYFRNDIPERYLCKTCAEVCGDRLDTASIVHAGKKKFICSCSYCNMCTIQLARPDRTAEVHQFRGLNIFANLIANASVDASSVENIIGCLVSMTNTGTVELIKNENMRLKKLKSKEKILHDIVFREETLSFLDDANKRLLERSGAGTRIMDILAWILNPPSPPLKDTPTMAFSKYYPYNLRYLCEKNPNIQVLTLKCISNICKGIPYPRRNKTFEIAILSRVSGTNLIKDDESEDDEDHARNDNQAFTEEASDTIARNYEVCGKLWHEKILREATKLHTAYSRTIVSDIKEMAAKYKEKLEYRNKTRGHFNGKEIQRLKLWEKKFLRFRLKENAITGQKVPIIKPPKILKRGSRLKEGWKLTLKQFPEPPPGATTTVFFTEYNVEGYNAQDVRVEPENGLLRSRLQFPLWELQDFVHNIAMVDLHPKFNHKRCEAYKEKLKATMETQVMTGNVVFKRPGTTKVNLVIAFIRPKKIDLEPFLPLPYSIRKGNRLAEGMQDGVIIGISEVCHFSMYVNQPLNENINRVRKRLFRKSKLLNAERCIIDTFSRGLSDTLRDSSSVMSLLGEKLGVPPINMAGAPAATSLVVKPLSRISVENILEFHSVNGLRILVERKRVGTQPASLFANLGILHFAVHRKNNLLRHQAIDLMEALNDDDESWVGMLTAENLREYKDVRQICTMYYVSRSLYEITKRIVLMELAVAQRFLLLLGRTLLDLIDKRFDEETNLFAIRSCGLLPMSSGGVCADFVVESHILEMLMDNQSHNSRESIILASIEALIGFGMVHRFKQKMLSLNVTKYLKDLLRNISGMVQFGGAISTFASFGEIILSPEEMTLSHSQFERNISRKVFEKCLVWARVDSGYSTEYRWKAMGTLVAFSRSFGTHVQLIQKKKFDFILSLALYSSPSFPTFGTSPCQAEALEIILNLTRSPLGLLLWMPFMDQKRLWLDYSGNFQPVLAMSNSRKPEWIGSFNVQNDFPDLPDGSNEEEDIEIRRTKLPLYRGVKINSKNVFLTSKDGVALPTDWTISFWFSGGEWIKKRKEDPNFFYTLVESTNGDKLIAMNHMCELGTLAAGEASEFGLKNAIWYGTDFDISNRADTVDPIATKAGKNIWHHIVCVGQTVTHEGVTSSTTTFYYNAVALKTFHYKCTTNVYAVGNSAQRGNASTNWCELSDFRLYKYAFPRSSSSWLAEVSVKPAVDADSLRVYNLAVNGSNNPLHVLERLANNQTLIYGLLQLVLSSVLVLKSMALQCLLNISRSIKGRILISENRALMEALDELTFSNRPEIKRLARMVLISVY